MTKNKDIKPAKICYTHIGGKLGSLLLDNFVEKGWLAKSKPTDKHFHITELGEHEFLKLGIDVSKIKLENL